MSSGMKLNTPYAMRGPTLRINLIALCYYNNNMNILHNSSSEATTATTKMFVIDNLVQVSFKVKSAAVANTAGVVHKHKVSMLATKHELAKNDAISMNVTCNALMYTKKWTCSDFMNGWKDIGHVLAPISSLIPNVNKSLSHTEIIINVCTMTKPAFPQLYEDSEFTDFTLSTADGEVAVHKACLAMRSPVFKTMFSGTWKESTENIVKIKNYNLQTIQHLKKFLYLSILPDDGLRPLITLAAQYSINDLIKECAWKLAETVKPEDLVSLHELACANNIPELSYAISQLTLDNVIDCAHQIRKKNDKNKTIVQVKEQAEGQ